MRRLLCYVLKFYSSIFVMISGGTA